MGGGWKMRAYAAGASEGDAASTATGGVSGECLSERIRTFLEFHLIGADVSASDSPDPSSTVFAVVPALLSFCEKLERAHNRIEQLQDERLEQEKRISTAEQEVTRLTGIIESQRRRFEDFQNLHTAQATKINSMNQEMENANRYFEGKLAELDKQKAAMQDAVSHAHLLLPTTGPDANLYKTISLLGSKLLAAKSEFDKSASNSLHSDARDAFHSWERKYCAPSIEVVELQEKIWAVGDRNRRQHLADTAALIEREKALTIAIAQHEEQSKLLDASHRAFIAQQEEKTKELKAREAELTLQQDHWHRVQAEKLQGPELEAVQAQWIKQQEEIIIPKLKVEIQTESKNVAKREFEGRHRTACNQARDEGRELGRQEGYSEGQAFRFASGSASGLAELEEKLEQAKEEGRRLERTEAESQARRDQQDAYKRGSRDAIVAHENEVEIRLTNARYESFHSAMLMATHKFPDLFTGPSGAPNSRHPYWRGRAIAYHVKTKKLLSDVSSSWYNADHDADHWLDVCRLKDLNIRGRTYWHGVWEGLYEQNILEPDWKPSSARRVVEGRD